MNMWYGSRWLIWNTIRAAATAANSKNNHCSYPLIVYNTLWDCSFGIEWVSPHRHDGQVKDDRKELQKLQASVQLWVSMHESGRDMLRTATRLDTQWKIIILGRPDGSQQVSPAIHCWLVWECWCMKPGGWVPSLGRFFALVYHGSSDGCSMATSFVNGPRDGRFWSSCD